MIASVDMVQHECQQVVPIEIMRAIIKQESGGNPHAIGLDGRDGERRYLVRQPKNKAEAIATARSLMQQGYRFSVGTSQVHISNFSKYGLDWESAFDACRNVQVGAHIFNDCLVRAQQNGYGERSLGAALSCYNSGRFEAAASTKYVASVSAMIGGKKSGKQSKVSQRTRSAAGSSIAQAEHVAREVARNERPAASALVF